jgi:hypothetical protein
LAGVAYLTLTVHVPRGASGVANEQVVPVTLYKLPILIVRTSCVICSGAAPVLVTVMTLVTGARGAGIVNVRVGVPEGVPSVPLVAEVKLSVPNGAATTVNVTELVVPIVGVVTLTALGPDVAVDAIAQLAVTVVGLDVPVTVHVTPVPVTVTAVAPVKLVPVRVTGTVVVPVAGAVADVGEIELRVGPVTVSAPVRMGIPIGVTTLTSLAVSAAAGVMVQLALTVAAVGVPVTAQVTPPPDTFTAVAPVRRVPERVIAKAGPPRVCDVGLIEPSVGPSTVNCGVFMLTVVVPIGVVTMACLLVVGALAEIAQLAVTVVAVATIFVQVTPAVLAPRLTAVAPVKLVPVRVTGTVVPRAPDVGVIPVSVGPFTVNVTALVVPFGVTTLTFLTIVAAVVVMAQLAVTVVTVGVPVMVQVTPVPETVTAVAPVRPFPVMVTGTVAPRRPEVGLIEVSEGGSTVNVTGVVIPPGVERARFLIPRGVLPAMVSVDVAEVGLTTVTAPNVMVG